MNKHMLKLGDVVWVKLYSEGNHIQNGVRPAVIVQNNKGNKYSPTIQVVPITSKKKKPLPTHVQLPAGVANLTENSIAQCEGARPVSKTDILGFIGIMPREYMARISEGILISTPIIQYLSLEQLTLVHDQLVAS